MATFEPKDANFEQRLEASFRRQKVMDTIGAALTRMAPGYVEIEMAFDYRLTQQHGYMHAGIVTAIMDSAPVAIMTATMIHSAASP